MMISNYSHLSILPQAGRVYRDRTFGRLELRVSSALNAEFWRVDLADFWI